MRLIPTVFADLGYGVLDTAMVETAASVVDTGSGHLLPSVFFRAVRATR